MRMKLFMSLLAGTAAYIIILILGIMLDFSLMEIFIKGIIVLFSFLFAGFILLSLMEYLSKLEKNKDKEFLPLKPVVIKTEEEQKD
jgi:hypothetical protein